MPWWGLKAILDENRKEQDTYNALPPDACPVCGTPLVTGKGGVRDCPMGCYQWTGGQRLT